VRPRSGWRERGSTWPAAAFLFYRALVVLLPRLHHHCPNYGEKGVGKATPKWTEAAKIVRLKQSKLADHLRQLHTNQLIFEQAS